MKRLAFPLMAVGVVAVTAGAGWLIGAWRHRSSDSAVTVANSTTSTKSMNRGAMLYQAYCASCHGDDGHGDGSAAADLRPPPRDFAVRPWRFEPTADSIRKVTANGIPGTVMASFRLSLPPADLDAVVSHVQRLATSSPPMERDVSEDKQLLMAAGFASLFGSVPPPLKLTDAKGRTLQLDDYLGRAVILHFWGTDCVHCVKEIPAMNELGKKHAKRLAILHVCVDEEDPGVAQKVLDKFAPGTTAFTESAALGLVRYEVQVLPTVWLISPDGKAVGRASGVRDWNAEPVARLIARWVPENVPTRAFGEER